MQRNIFEYIETNRPKALWSKRQLCLTLVVQTDQISFDHKLFANSNIRMSQTMKIQLHQSKRV